jgi:hypothetical protein
MLKRRILFCKVLMMNTTFGIIHCLDIAHRPVSEVQGDQQVFVHLMITVQKTRKNILNSFTYHDNVVLY